MIVLVGLLKQIAQSGFCSLTAMFFLYVVGVFVVAAILHPQEFFDVLHGFLYFLAIPCTSMLLIFYSLANLHVVSWGTREEYKPPSLETSSPKTSTPKKGRKGILSYSKNNNDKNYSSDFTFSFGNMFRCVCCPKPETKQEEILSVIVEKIEDLEYAFRNRDDDDDEDDRSVERDQRQPGNFINRQMSEMPNFSSLDIEGIRCTYMVYYN